VKPLKYVTSAGGVVFHGRRVLILRKMNGDWVLPKGKIEAHESPENAATREVSEETGVTAQITRYLDETGYRFRNIWSQQELIIKRVHWYAMIALSTEIVPLEEEGFIEGRFVDVSEIDRFLRYSDEREMVQKGKAAMGLDDLHEKL
jgi:8-oxo-dGTP pyrophosphatase MutT (NUDIX family)